MADVQSLLTQALLDAPVVEPSPVPFTLSQTKQAQVAAAAESKKAVLAPDPYQLALGQATGKGAASAGPLEADLRTMDPYAFQQKYGPAGEALRVQALDADREVYRDATRPRSSGALLWDSLTGILGTGAVQLAGIAPPVVGLANPQAGARMAQGLAGAQEAIHGIQSDALAGARRLHEAKNALTERDNARQRQRELTDGKTELVADLRRFGRDVLSSLDNLVESPTMAAQGAADAMGSLLAGGLAAKGLKLGGAALTGGRLTAPGVRLAAEMDRGLGTLSTARLADGLARVGSWSAFPAATVLW